MDAYTGSIFAVGFNFAPQNSPGTWALCDGRLYNINDYQALYSLLGTTYGGDGVTTFGVPDLRGRAPIGQGQGTGLTNRPYGTKGGDWMVALTTANIPAHTHALTVGPLVAGGAANSQTPENCYFGSGPNVYASAPTGPDAINPSTEVTSNYGTSAGLSTIPPYLVINYVICMNGIYPTQQ